MSIHPPQIPWTNLNFKSKAHFVKRLQCDEDKRVLLCIGQIFGKYYMLRNCFHIKTLLPCANFAIQKVCLLYNSCVHKSWTSNSQSSVYCANARHNFWRKQGPRPGVIGTLLYYIRWWNSQNQETCLKKIRFLVGLGSRVLDTVSENTNQYLSARFDPSPCSYFMRFSKKSLPAFWKIQNPIRELLGSIVLDKVLKRYSHWKTSLMLKNHY